MFDQNLITRTMLVDLAKERDLREVDNRDIPTDPNNWTDSLVATLAIKQFLEPNAGHLRADLFWLKIGGRFRLRDNEWLVTDIGSRTMTAIKIDDSIRAEHTLLNGPSYAVVEHAITFDEDDFEIVERV